MAEALGTALGLVGAVGVLGQIFSGCIKAYSIFTTASNLGRDSERLVCKIRIEEMRLLVWGREWGVVEGKLEAHLQAESTAGNERMRQLATQILSELYKTITDFKRLQEKYGLMEEPTSPLSEKAVAQKTAEVPSVTSRLRNELHLKAKCRYWGRNPFPILNGLEVFSRENVSISLNSRINLLRAITDSSITQGLLLIKKSSICC
jgi:Prion-inhibition and propagation